ncbi:protein FAM166C isoform X2 [Dromiciops gliroides]|uniref:protein FAM166C isoform X2 n=1 Tax=Dromiciops gliroides TaxID=33562 RepID=UPI001CC3EEBD|nr:protein FAM166C isoform X2 [Dromiciops gliroides]
MASRGAGTLLTGNNTAYVPPCLMPGYQGHVPNVAFSFGDTYGNATYKYFQDCRNSALDTSYSPYSKGGQFPTLCSPNPNLVLGYRSHAWDRWLHTPTYTRYNLDCNRSTELKQFYQEQHSEPGNGAEFKLISKALKRPPLSPKKKWHLFRMAPENLKTHQTFPSGKRVSTQERYVRDCYFEYRA